MEQKDNIPTEQPKVAIQDKIKEVYGQELLDLLKSVHPSDTHVLIRDHMTKEQMKRIKADTDIPFKKEFYQIKEQASSSYEHDHKLVNNLMLDRVVTRVYGILLNMIKVQQEEIDGLRTRLDAIDGKQTEAGQ